jgi:hypothetical protein
LGAGSGSGLGSTRKAVTLTLNPSPSPSPNPSPNPNPSTEGALDNVLQARVGGGHARAGAAHGEHEPGAEADVRPRDHAEGEDLVGRHARFLGASDNGTLVPREGERQRPSRGGGLGDGDARAHREDGRRGEAGRVRGDEPVQRAGADGQNCEPAHVQSELMSGQADPREGLGSEESARVVPRRVQLRGAMHACRRAAPHHCACLGVLIGGTV